MANLHAYLVFFIITVVSLFQDVVAQKRSCPLDKFCPINHDAGCVSNTSLCVIECPTDSDHMQQGNWTSGNCERSKDLVLYRQLIVAI